MSSSRALRALALPSLVGLGLVSAGSEIIASGPSTRFVMDEGEASQAIMTASTLNGKSALSRKALPKHYIHTFAPLYT